ncbi:hypothetical protein LPB19_08755 [Marinobacter salinisoli]|uniref:Uncharacterized protein n=1 Tax=Marinobacter salinisoli TaxID=2769486 RepID=A0ABX7MQG4_9GAMM|nr:hypothetical protein [Marinobacter salinisoli]QSP93326.1 hypothetical protein LPB19_08755 [Marinobacter salinisoli]
MKKAVLAGSDSYKLCFRYESATLEGGQFEKPLVVAEFPFPLECGCIDFHEKWVVTGGQGIVIYYLKPPFEPHRLAEESLQWKTLWYPNKSLNMFPEAIVQVDDETVRILIDVNSENAGVYDVNVYTLETIKRM